MFGHEFFMAFDILIHPVLLIHICLWGVIGTVLMWTGGAWSHKMKRQVCEAIWIRIEKTLNRDEGSYKLPHAYYGIINQDVNSTDKVNC